MGGKKPPLVSKPLGDSEKHNWDFSGMGFRQHEGPCVCELCGTKHPLLAGSEDEVNADSSRYHLFKLLGYYVVLECCGGALLDELYEWLGNPFCMTLLRELAEHPTEGGFGYLLLVLDDHMEKAQKKLQERSQGVEEVQRGLKATKAMRDLK